MSDLFGSASEDLDWANDLGVSFVKFRLACTSKLPSEVKINN